MGINTNRRVVVVWLCALFVAIAWLRAPHQYWYAAITLAGILLAIALIGGRRKLLLAVVFTPYPALLLVCGCLWASSLLTGRYVVFAESANGVSMPIFARAAYVKCYRPFTKLVVVEEPDGFGASVYRLVRPHLWLFASASNAMARATLDRRGLTACASGEDWAAALRSVEDAGFVAQRGGWTTLAPRSGIDFAVALRVADNIEERLSTACRGIGAHGINKPVVVAVCEYGRPTREVAHFTCKGGRVARTDSVK